MADATATTDMTDSLKRKAISQLKEGYDRTKMTQAMSASVPLLYKASAGYLKAILDAFYCELPSDDASPLHRTQLSLRDRERVLIAILASQNDGAALAIHMYSALMEGVTNAEIAHILMLTGTYTGISHFTRALFVQKVLSEKLTEIANGPVEKRTPSEVVKAILVRFEPALMLPEQKPETSSNKKTG